MNRIRLLGACVAVCACVAAMPAGASAKTEHTGTASASKPVITISGSTSVAPLTVKLIKGYLKQYPGRVKFKLAQGGSDIGVADAAAGRVSIGASSRDPKASDPGGLVFNKIARDALCVATNTGNPIANLSQPDVQAIFSGKVRDWKDVPGSTITGPINIVVRTAASGTQDAFQKLFMGTGKIADSAAQKASNGLVAQAVKSDKQAVGYVSYAFTAGLHDVAYKGVECSLRTAKSGEYPGSRNFWMVTRGAPAKGSPVQKFIYWIQKSAKAAKLTATEWVPLS